MKNLNRKRLVIFLIVNSVSIISFSQSAENTVYSQTEFYQIQEELQGKYQIQMIGIRAQPAISQELLLEIRDRQKQSERVYFEFTSKVRIMILSKDEISNGDSISEEESVIYIN